MAEGSFTRTFRLQIAARRAAQERERAEGMAALARRAGDALSAARPLEAANARSLTRDLIADGLAAAQPDIPVVSDALGDGADLKLARRFFLIDPLSGAEAYETGDPAFTVSIAFVEDGAPRLGVVYAPALERFFWTPNADVAVEERRDGPRRLWAGARGEGPPAAASAPLPRPAPRLRIVTSKNHGDPDTERFVARLANAERALTASSLKFCLIAAGEADLYPQLGPTKAWDTAAGHAVLRAAGGRIRRATPDGRSEGPLRYEAGAARNPPFLAFAADVALPSAAA